jgi:hypothetical protein
MDTPVPQQQPDQTPHHPGGAQQAAGIRQRPHAMSDVTKPAQVAGVFNFRRPKKRR